MIPGTDFDRAEPDHRHHQQEQNDNANSRPATATASLRLPETKELRGPEAHSQWAQDRPAWIAQDH